MPSRTRRCSVAAYDALGRLAATGPAFELTKAVARMFRSGEEGESEETETRGMPRPYSFPSLL